MGVEEKTRKYRNIVERKLYLIKYSLEEVFQVSEPPGHD